MGIGDWGYGDWGLGFGVLGVGANPHTQPPDPHTHSPLLNFLFIFLKKIVLI